MGWRLPAALESATFLGVVFVDVGSHGTSGFRGVCCRAPNECAGSDMRRSRMSMPHFGVHAAGCAAVPGRLRSEAAREGD